MLEQHGIDLKRRNLLSAAVDQFLESPSERQVILCIENSLVSRAKIPIRERAGVRVGVVAVPMHHVAPTDRDFSLLALALTDTIAGRRVRRVLESELSDADRHLFHSRAVEGVVHNLRNHVATAVGYLKEIDPRQLDPVNRANLDTATAAASDAVTVLRSLSQGATPKVSYSPDPVDLNELVTRALSLARPSARAKEVLLAVRESPEEVKVRADPLLMREVITNLLNNAIDAVDSAGHVEMTTGRRGNGWPYFSVADDGPGISDDHRHRLFEPHFTTKETGTGLGLFMSYGIVREHQGDLLYEGGRRGAVFTVTLPPFVV